MPSRRKLVYFYLHVGYPLETFYREITTIELINELKKKVQKPLNNLSIEGSVSLNPFSHILAANISQDRQIKRLDEHSGQNSGRLPTEHNRITGPSWLSGRLNQDCADSESKETFIAINSRLRLALPD